METTPAEGVGGGKQERWKIAYFWEWVKLKFQQFRVLLAEVGVTGVFVRAGQWLLAGLLSRLPTQLWLHWLPHQDHVETD